MTGIRRKRLLILGGTTEARELAALAVGEFGERLDVITSLAGRTTDPVALSGGVRSGGFGGASGLTAFLRDAHIDLIVDATHPFATQISQHAAAAAAEAQVPRLTLLRPAWRPQEGDRWIEASNASDAAAKLPSWGRRAWLTVGSADVAAFATLADIWFLIRRVEPPSKPIGLPKFELILGRGPFALADERRLIAEHRIDVLVCRDSGGTGSETKLIAARDAGLPVIMMARPPQHPEPAVATPAAALAWLRGRVNS